MHKKIYIFLLIIISIPVSGQILRENGFKLVYPEDISANSVFDISLVASNPYNNVDTLEIFFIPSQKILFKNLALRSVYNESNIICNEINIDGLTQEVYKADIPLSENNLSPKTFFQLLFSFKADNAKTASFEFSGIFKSKGNIKGYIQSPVISDSRDEYKFITIPLNFYKPQKYAVNAVSFNPGSEMDINLTDVDVNNLLVEFWVKINNTKTDFLKIINKQSSRTLFDISTNPFQMITIKSDNQNNEKFINPYFIARGVWYHFSVLMSFDNNDISFYCNNTLISKNKLSYYIKAGDLLWKFVNNSQNKNYQLDVLRAIALNNNIRVSFLNRNYINFIADSSIVLYQLNFDNENELELAKNRMDLTYNSLNFIKSDAPIFVRAPELNINVIGNSYELTWSGGDYKHAETYILEKSINNSDYEQVSTIQADNYNEKIYSILDSRDQTADVIYYRIEQVNFDGSIIYSSQVKIGQGTMEPFILEQNYPNPFNPRTSIVVDVLEDSDFDITIYNLEGKEITKLFKGYLTSGTHKFSFDASELPSGIYLYKVTAPNYSDTKKMILTK